MNKTQDIIAKNIQLLNAQNNIFKKDVDYLRNCGIVIYISGCRKGKGIKGGYQNNMLKFDGELIAVYCIGYGIGRFLIEGLRMDSLMIGSTGIRVSQMLALILVVFGTGWIVYNFKKSRKNHE